MPAPLKFLLRTAALLLALPAAAQTAPDAIKIGHLHAGSGGNASISMPVYDGLRIWVDQMNAGGGAFVKPYNKKIPLKLISYDDQSNPATATTLTNQLITQDKVDLLVSDSGSLLTAVSVPVAREHKMLLFNPTGTGAAFFSKDNPYIVLIADPVSTIWPKYIADFLKADGLAAGIKRVAILYSTNDFTGTQANALRGFLKGSPIEIVYDQGVPTTTSNYTVTLNNIANANPDAVLELGYVGNDIAFLRNLQDSGQKFKMVFAIYPGIETSVLLKNVGAEGLAGIFTYVTSASINYKPEFGMTQEQYRATWVKTYPDKEGEFGLNAIAGYTTGLVIEQALANTVSMEQLALRKAVGDLSGKLRTLDGDFILDETGAQIGEITPIGQVSADGAKVKLTTVYPPEHATGKPNF
jgi:branched-chain amino acid transport system substrate-binding protein